MRNKPWFFLIFVVLTLTPIAVAAAEINYVGSENIGAILMEDGAAKAFEAKTKIKINVDVSMGSGKGIKALIDGKVPIAGAGRTLTAEEKKQNLVWNIVAYDAIGVVVNKNNPISNLSKEQLKGIFTGKIKNWKEVGGKNAPINPTSAFLESKRGTLVMVQELVMDGAPYGDFKRMETPKEQVAEVSRNENGICCASIAMVNGAGDEVRKKTKTISVNQIAPTSENVRSGAYIIARPLVLATKGLPQGEVKQLVDFMLSPEGQAFAARRFVPVRR